MRYRYKFARLATQELKQEIAYSSSRWGVRHAELYRQEVKALIVRIADNPFVYPLRPDIGHNVRLVRYKGNYLVYSVNEQEKQLEIITFSSIHRPLRHPL